MRLMKVREDRHLYYPNSFPRDEQYRGGPGYVVDLDAPLEASWCEGQEYKLVPADAGSKPSAIKCNHALRLLKEHAAKTSGAPATQAQPVAKVGGSMPSVDIPPTRKPKE